MKPHGCPDTDGDGVPDMEDECRDESGTAPSGCPPDADKDGVPIPEDRCPEVRGVKPHGCLDDGDGDGVLYVKDWCPERVGAPPFGCPGSKDAFVIQDLIFTTNSDRLLSRAMRALDRLASDFQVHTGSFELICHTDGTGEREENLDLSRRRAEVTKKYLVDHGVDGSRITPRGAGNDDPLALPTSSENREKNRRCEMKARE